ncbi:ATP:cob(I)alamin adenosyltransferase [Mobilisporobacter senegalensis]|uniref:Corrinoid adenosyltransferase n=1 Tax=Mobilisporobacter senegalensis TaxID=1329262 RepID=A0A3N1XVZ2_9FIRM|nr:cob(I)yrinic acid a,c-diamide adenosyltransferase [Mobilisporobacter senegalensis]ROR29097.1 ATP:cob(I)alamin adenosyltransferase [Mobilisporobacter senegalensis]
MSIYTKTGDNGSTKLMKLQNVSKSDERIQLLGNIDELTSNLGLIKASSDNADIKNEIERIQKNLMTIMACIADQFNQQHKMNEAEVIHLEEEINRMESSFSRKNEFILPGQTKESAQIDIARTVARRAERWLAVVDRKFNADSGAKKYMNRLADYLYMLARYTDFMLSKKSDKETTFSTSIQRDRTDDEIISAVLQKLGLGNKNMTLSSAKKLIEKVEERAKEVGLNAVIAVCGPDGNPIAVHVMDGAYLASFDIAMKKAYTSVAVKMSTKRLGELAKPGETFYGIDKADNGRMIIFGGGVPLMAGDMMIGGLGVSGGTSEEDSHLADYGLEVLDKVL